MQEPVFVLHLFTCHGRIMPRLGELLFSLGICKSHSWTYLKLKLDSSNR